MVKEVQQLIGRIATLNYFVSKTTDRCLPFFKVLKKNLQFDWTFECEEVFSRLKEYLSQPPFLSKPRLREDMYLYLVVSNVNVSTVLIQEEEGTQLLIYYVSHSMVLAETRYLNMEKLALALLVALWNLRPYFQAHPIIVFISHPLRQVLHRREVSGRLIWWSIELSQYEVRYLP